MKKENKIQQIIKHIKTMFYNNVRANARKKDTQTDFWNNDIF